MAKISDIEVRVRTNVRVEHKVLRRARHDYAEHLQATCGDAERAGLALIRILDAGEGYSVLVFAGGRGVLGGEEEADDAA